MDRYSDVYTKVCSLVFATHFEGGAQSAHACVGNIETNKTACVCSVQIRKWRNGSSLIGLSLDNCTLSPLKRVVSVLK